MGITSIPVLNTNTVYSYMVRIGLSKDKSPELTMISKELPPQPID